jgi:hypothetical protein
MALKITTQIGTDKGITSEAYVRISNYQLHKFGSANLQIEIFQSEDDVNPNTAAYSPTTMVGQARNQQIGDSLYVSLMTQEEREVSYPVNGVDADGNALPDRIETITVSVPDLSSAEGVDIFTFGYSHLKAKLVDLFGEDNVVDC